MGFARTCAVTLVGVEGVVVEVQADLEPGVAAFTLVGLPDKSLTESRDRVRAAVVNSGGEWPQKKLTVGLSPASVPKAGSGFDIAVACAVLGAAERIDPRVLADLVMIGELGLDGRVRPVRGILPAVLAAADAGYEQVVVPECSAAEASLVPGVSVLGIRSLRQLIAVLTDEPVPEETEEHPGPEPLLAGLRAPGTGADIGMHAGGAQDHGHDLADVVGQRSARTAVEVAAAGGHHLFLEGPPGAGKTMLAERLPSILPPLDRQASLEVTAVHSVAGLLPPGKPLIDTAPYCAPHHSATMQALVGGGPGTARPGAVSLSHQGVLFLDETPEFSSRALDALRQPLEAGEVTIARGEETATYPARGMFVLACNPCPCGRFTADPASDGCRCLEVQRRAYRRKLDGPVMDRIDITRRVRPVPEHEANDPLRSPEPSSVVLARVTAARGVQQWRYAGLPWRLNSQTPGPLLREEWPLAAPAVALLDAELYAGRLTRRGATRVHRLAWTVADLRGVEQPGADELRVALRLRSGEPLELAALERRCVS